MSGESPDRASLRLDGWSARPSAQPAGRGRWAPVGFVVLVAAVAGALAVALAPVLRVADWTGGSAPDATGPVPVGHLTAGQCFNRERTPRTTTHGEDVPAPIRVLPCTREHDSEVVGVTRPSASAGTPLGDVDNQGEALCRESLRRYVLDPLSLPEDSQILWYVVMPSSWRTDGARLVCVNGTEIPLTRSLRQDRTTLTAGQLRYLAAVQDDLVLMRSIDAGDPPPGWQQQRVLAGRMAAVLERERAGLAGGTWPADVRPAVARLVASDTAAIPIWRRAGAAPTEARLQGLIDEAVGTPLEDHRTVRRLLGLSTVQGEPPRGT